MNLKLHYSLKLHPPWWTCAVLNNWWDRETCLQQSITILDFELFGHSKSVFDWLVFQEKHSSSVAASLISITSVIVFFWVSCLPSTISGSCQNRCIRWCLFQKKVDYTIPKTLHQSALIGSCFKNTKCTRIPLYSFQRHKSTKRKITRRENGS